MLRRSRTDSNAGVRGHGVLAHASRSSLSLSMQLSRTRNSWMVGSSSCLFWWMSFTALISLSMTVDDPFCRLRYSAISSLALRLASLTTSSNCVVIFLAPLGYGGFDATTCGRAVTIERSLIDHGAGRLVLGGNS